jgi:hypothetical protein
MRDAPFRLGIVSMFAAAMLAIGGCDSGSSTGGNTGTGGSNAGIGGATGAGGKGTGGSTTGTGGTTTGTGGTTGGGGVTGTGGTGTAGRSGTGGSGAGGTAGMAGGSGGRAGTGGSGGTSATQTSTNVLLHHNTPGRTGVYVDAALTKAAVMNLHVDSSFANTSIMGPVYAQPLYLGGAGSSQNDMVIVATAQNRVYALNASDGKEAWPNMQYGAPITTQADINSRNRPLLPFGVVGTPAIDASTRTLYFSAATLVSNKTNHRIHAVDLTNGMEKSGWPVSVDTAAKNAEGDSFIPTNQNQRGAVIVVGGRVFVPYGGHIGDADNYHGWVVGVSTTTPTDVKAWSTRALDGGIWASSGIASDGTSIFFATGNTTSTASTFAAPSAYGDGESIYKLGNSLARTTTATDVFYPANWATLDNGDTDISGSGVILFDAPGATPSALALVLGKDGNAYLLNRANLGGMNATPLALKKVANGAIIQAGAAYTTASGTYFVFKGATTGCPTPTMGGVMAVKVAGNPPTMTPAWCAGPNTGGSPAVSMTDAQGGNAIVWFVSGSSLYAVDGDTGTSVLSGASLSLTGATVKGHQTPMIANGRVFVGSDNRIFALTP